MSGALTFRDLPVGGRFLFAGDREREARLLAELRIVYRTKTSQQDYESTHADGDTSAGRVGVGDNPVERVEGER